MKLCSVCRTAKPLEDFYCQQRFNKTKDALVNYLFPHCKLCNSQRKRDKDHTRDGIAGTLYLSQKLHSKNRQYALPNYTEDELREWLHAQPTFESMFVAWEHSGFLSDLKPSCNRLDDYAPYSLSNIELVTWKRNKEMWAKDCIEGRNRKISRPVLQFDQQGTLINEYFSIQEACRQVQVSHANVIGVCTGRRKNAGGYYWQYKYPQSAPKHTGFIGRP
jgi:hypothetical protein